MCQAIFREQGGRFRMQIIGKQVVAYEDDFRYDADSGRKIRRNKHSRWMECCSASSLVSMYVQKGELCR